MVKNQPANAGDARDPGSIDGSGRSSEAGNGNPLPIFLPGKSLEQRNLVGYNPWGCKGEVKECACVCVRVRVCVCVCACVYATLLWNITYLQTKKRMGKYLDQRKHI